jgi:hypothetical protein
MLEGGSNTLNYLLKKGGYSKLWLQDRQILGALQVKCPRLLKTEAFCGSNEVSKWENAGKTLVHQYHFLGSCIVGRPQLVVQKAGGR